MRSCRQSTCTEHSKNSFLWCAPIAPCFNRGVSEPYGWRALLCGAEQSALQISQSVTFPKIVVSSIKHPASKPCNEIQLVRLANSNTLLMTCALQPRYTVLAVAVFLQSSVQELQHSCTLILVLLALGRSAQLSDSWGR